MSTPVPQRPLRSIIGRLKPVAARLPPTAQEALRHIRAKPRRAPVPVRWGSVRRQQPFSPDQGNQRGQAVDRLYLEAYLSRYATDIRGAVLEVRDPEYATRYGNGQVVEIDVL